jgi:hypothetical protein
MYELDFWTQRAEAMELCLEGNRLIAQEVGDIVRTLWHRAIRKFDGLLENLGQHRHLPPI